MLLRLKRHLIPRITVSLLTGRQRGGDHLPSANRGCSPSMLKISLRLFHGTMNWERSTEFLVMIVVLGIDNIAFQSAQIDN